MSTPPEIESSPVPAVSSLRSRWEQLAADTSSASLNKTATSNLGLLAANPRPRAVSGSSGPQPVESPTLNPLRTSSSSSDLKGTKRPPPPPPLSARSSKPVSPSASPLQRPSNLNAHHASSSLSNIQIHGSIPNLSTSQMRKPPPPPSFHANSDSTIFGVASLANKFASSSLSKARPPSVASNSSRNVTPSNSTPPYSESPFYDGDSDSEAETEVHREPPPLPSRKNGHAHHREYSIDSTDSNSSISSKSDVPSVSLHRIVPPPPPPRPKGAMPPTGFRTPSFGNLTTLQTPPPLPARRATIVPVDELSPSRRTQAHSNSLFDSPVSEPSSSPSSGSPPAPTVTERKILSALPPPPKRQIAPGDELPELKRQYLSDSSDDEEEEETKLKADLPDTSRSTRRPPITTQIYSDHNINIPAHHGMYAVSGQTVVVGISHSIKIYNLSVSDNHLWSLDTKDIAPDHRPRKVSSLEFRLPIKDQDRGFLVWIGTKEGHLFEMDVRTATLVSAKMAAHSHPVTHIFRYGYSMITIGDNGKVLIFSPESEKEDIVLSKTQPKVMRIVDKQVFIKLIGTQLWTSAREPNASNSTSRGPIIRVYDVFSPGTTGRSLLPIEQVGTVTCGTILPSTPGFVYLGHEGGNVTIWSLNTLNGTPECIDMIKVSMSDILCLAGVNDRLWSGTRTGHIAAYDVTIRPWVMTNCWMAHNSLPVSAISVDPWSIEKASKLYAISVGRDERLKFWDGLLSVDWVDHELMKQEASYSTYRKLSVLIVSWNIDANKPDALQGTADNINFLQNVLTSTGVPDIISFGFQEVVDLESRRTAAKSVLLGSKTKANDGSISQKVSTAYKKWNDQLILSVRLAMPPDVPYSVIHSETLVGLYTCIFVKNSERISMKDAHINTIKCGMAGNYGNKGAIIGRFVIDDSSLCFINCHLAAGQHQTRQRGRDVAAILEERALFPENAIMEPVAFTNGGDGSMILDHEIVFFSGDMNYRIEQRREAAVALIRSGEYQSMHSHDQLLKEMKFNRGFRLRSFLEGPLRFIPTYKYDPRTDEFDSSHKRRVPAWCDRILWRSLDHSRVKQTQYRRWEANISDHRPISGAFELTVKSIKPELRVMIKCQVEVMWKEHERNLLATVRRFYVDQFLL